MELPYKRKKTKETKKNPGKQIFFKSTIKYSWNSYKHSWLSYHTEATFDSKGVLKSTQNSWKISVKDFIFSKAWNVTKTLTPSQVFCLDYKNTFFQKSSCRLLPLNKPCPVWNSFDHVSNTWERNSKENSLQK